MLQSKVTYCWFDTGYKKCAHMKNSTTKLQNQEGGREGRRESLPFTIGSLLPNFWCLFLLYVYIIAVLQFSHFRALAECLLALGNDYVPGPSSSQSWLKLWHHPRGESLVGTSHARVCRDQHTRGTVRELKDSRNCCAETHGAADRSIKARVLCVINNQSQQLYFSNV